MSDRPKPDACVCERYHIVSGSRVHWCILGELGWYCAYPARMCRCKLEIEAGEGSVRADIPTGER